MSGVILGVKRELSIDELKKVSEKDLVFILRFFFRFSRVSRRRIIVGWFVFIVISSVLWICRKLNLILVNSILVMVSWFRRMVRLRVFF